MDQTKEQQACPKCSATSIDTNTELATAICRDCGAVLDSLDTLVLTDSDSRSKNQSPQTEDHGPQSDDWQQRVTITDASDKQLVEALSELDSITTSLHVESSVRLKAADLLTKAWKLNVMHGRSRSITIGACLIAACRMAHCPRPLRVIADTVNVQSSKLFDTYRTVVSELDLEPPATDTRDYFSYLQKETEVSDEVVDRAEQMLEKTQDIGGDPAGIAIAALYLAAADSETKITYVQAGNITGLTKETVWKKADAIRHSITSTLNC